MVGWQWRWLGGSEGGWVAVKVVVVAVVAVVAVVGWVKEVIIHGQVLHQYFMSGHSDYLSTGNQAPHHRVPLPDPAGLACRRLLACRGAAHTPLHFNFLCPPSASHSLYRELTTYLLLQVILLTHSRRTFTHYSKTSSLIPGTIFCSLKSSSYVDFIWRFMK